MKNNLVYNKSFDFSIRIVNLYKYLSSNKKEYIISKQVLRSGTSIGANISESIDAQSRKDFISKLSIALKEARETYYWLELLKKTDYLDLKKSESIIKDVDELIRLLHSIIKSSKMNN